MSSPSSPSSPSSAKSAELSFGIDRILNAAGGKSISRNDPVDREPEEGNVDFEWLGCSRYRPPKTSRRRKREGPQRRKSGRNPRIPFSRSQVAFLEAEFLRTPYPSGDRVARLARYLELSETRVKIWFQNRRAREKKDKQFKQKMALGSSVQSLRSKTNICSVRLPKDDLFQDLDKRENLPANFFHIFRQMNSSTASDSFQPANPLDFTTNGIINLLKS